MFTSLKQIVVQFFTPSVDKIVSDFQKVVTKLEKAAEYHGKRAVDCQSAIVAAATAKGAAEIEAAKAAAVAAKIRNLLS